MSATEQRPLRKGDRVQLKGTVQGVYGEHAEVTFDGNHSINYINPLALAKATILPRELQVGDQVTYRRGDIRGEIVAIRYGIASFWDSQRLAFCAAPLSDLTLDPDHKDETEVER